MEMRAIQDIGLGEDLTLPVRPLAAVLHDSTLSSHCSGCFSTIPRHLLSLFGDNSHYVPTPPLLIPPSIPPPVSNASSPTLLIPCGTPPPISASHSASLTFSRTFLKNVVTITICGRKEMPHQQILVDMWSNYYLTTKREKMGERERRAGYKYEKRATTRSHDNCVCA